MKHNEHEREVDAIVDGWSVHAYDPKNTDAESDLLEPRMVLTVRQGTIDLTFFMTCNQMLKIAAVMRIAAATARHGHANKLAKAALRVSLKARREKR